MMNTWAAVFHIKPGAKLALGRGIRTEIAALVPLVALAAMHRVALGEAAALGALFVSFCDVGGSARARAAAMGTATIAGAVLFALGRSIGGPWWLAVPAIFLATLAAGLVAVYGRTAVVVALFLNVAFAIALGVGGGPPAAPSSAVGFALGGVCALLLALAPWLARRDEERPAAPDPAAPDPTAPDESPPRRPARPSVAPFLANLTVGSPLFRFAALRAAGAAAAAAISWSWGVSRPHWAVLPVLICVLPDLASSLVKTAQFAAGTVLGAVVADVLIFTLRDPLALALLAVALMVFALAVQDMNGAISSCLLTITVLLLISIPTGGLSLASVKVLDALIGAAIALAVTSLASRVDGAAAAAPPEAAHA